MQNKLVIPLLFASILLIQALALPALPNLLGRYMQSAEALDQSQITQLVETVSTSFPDLQNAARPEIENCDLYLTVSLSTDDCSSLMWLPEGEGEFAIGAEFNKVDALIFKTEQIAKDKYEDVSDALDKLSFEEQSKFFDEPFETYLTAEGLYLRGDAEEYFRCGNLVINVVHSSGGNYKIVPLSEKAYGYERPKTEVAAMTEEKNRLIARAEPLLQSFITDLKGTLESKGICQPGQVAVQKQERKPVIFLPGVAGSDLYIGDKQVWPFAFTGYRDQLKLKANGIDSEKPGVVVTTKDIFRKNLLPDSIPIPPFGHISMPASVRAKINFYGPLIDSLEKGRELFNWDNVPRNTGETDKLLAFLNDKLGITWAIADKSKLKIVKDSSGNSTSISDGGPNSLTIDLDRAQKSAILRTTSTPDNKELIYYFYLEEAKGLKKIYERNYREGKDLFVFPYDWRLSNKVHFEKLKQMIDTALKNNPEAGKVILVAHSMGGVISKAFLFANPDMASKVDSLITLGTPFWGSPKPFFALMMGYDFGNPMINPQLMKDIGQNFPSVYELTPQSDFVHDSMNRKYLSFEEVFSIKYKGFKERIPFWKLGIINKIKHCCPPQDKWVNTPTNVWSANPDLVKAATQFHAPGGTINNPNPLPMGVKLYTIIGKGVKTLDHYEMRDAKDTDKTFLEFGQRKVVLEPKFKDGDGTVPMWSLNISKLATKEYYIPSVPGRPAAHGDLARIPCINEIVKAITIDNKPPSSTPASCQISPKGKLTGTEKEVDLEAGVDLTLHSDAHLSVIDEDGNTLGYDTFGGITENIPTGSFLDMDGVEYASIADTSRKYKVFVNGTNEGKFTLSVNISAQNLQPLAYSYTDVSVNNGTISEFDFTPNTLNQASVPDLQVSSEGSTKNVRPTLFSVGQGQEPSPISQQQQQGQQQARPAKAEMIDYENSDFRLAMKYPANWAVQENSDNVVFTSPTENEADTSVERVYIYHLGDIPLGESEEERLKSNIEATIDYREPSSDFKLLSSNSIEFNGKTAGQIEYTYTDSNIGNSKAKEIIAIDGNDRYDIVFIAKASEYTTTLPTAQEIIDSIEITPSQDDNESRTSDQGTNTAGDDNGTRIDASGETIVDTFDDVVPSDGGKGRSDSTQAGVEDITIPPSDFKDYSNSGFQLSMKYPSDWTVQEKPNQVTFVSPLSGESDQYLESLSIGYEGNLQLFETEQVTLDKNVEFVIENQKENLANFDLQESKDITLMGLPAHRIVYTMNDINIGPAKAAEYILINGNNRYDLLFVANPEQYDSVLPDAEEMINSMTLTSDDEP